MDVREIPGTGEKVMSSAKDKRGPERWSCCIVLRDVFVRKFMKDCESLLIEVVYVR